jgi:hypothetical protein
MGSRLWISSEEMSMNIEPSPSAQMLNGRLRSDCRTVEAVCPAPGDLLSLCMVCLTIKATACCSQFQCAQYFNSIIKAPASRWKKENLYASILRTKNGTARRIKPQD